jgi:hypothetical protein
MHRMRPREREIDQRRDVDESPHAAQLHLRDAVARIVIGLDSATGPAFMSNSPAFMHLNRD